MGLLFSSYFVRGLIILLFLFTMLTLSISFLVKWKPIVQKNKIAGSIGMALSSILIVVTLYFIYIFFQLVS